MTGGANAVVSGLFFDPPGVIASPNNISVAPNQTQQFNALVTDERRDSLSSHVPK